MNNNTINESELFRKYKSSNKVAFNDLSIHIFHYYIAYILLCYFKNNFFSLFLDIFLGLLQIKSFVIFHDCGHYSYFPNKTINYIVGSISGIFVLTPFCWNYDHVNHHLTNGNFENKLYHDFNESFIIDIECYKKSKYITRILYKIFKNPLFFYTIVSLFAYVIFYRFSILLHKLNNNKRYKEKLLTILFDTLFNNLGIISLTYFLNNNNLLFHYFIANLFSSLILFIIFNAEHTFNPSYIVNDKKWNFKDSGIKGSSFIIIPNYLKKNVWFRISSYSSFKFQNSML